MTIPVSPTPSRVKLRDLASQLADTPPENIEAMRRHSVEMAAWHQSYAANLNRVLKQRRRGTEVKH